MQVQPDADPPDDEPGPHGLLSGAVTNRAQDGIGSIRATLSAAHGLRVYTAGEQRAFPDGAGHLRHRLISVDAAIAGFDPAGRWREHDLSAAATLVIDHGAHGVWRTLTALLRSGDVLRLRFRAGSTLDALAGTGLHRDELHLLVYRGRREWTFLLVVAVRAAGPRMVIPAS